MSKFTKSLAMFWLNVVEISKIDLSSYTYIYGVFARDTTSDAFFDFLFCNEKRMGGCSCLTAWCSVSEVN